MRHPIPLVSIFILFISLSLQAQTDFRPGYYIRNEGDTVYGEIDYRGDLRNGRICTYRENEGSEITDFVPGEIKAYRFSGGKYYVSKEVTVGEQTQNIFLEFLVDGISDLYYFRNDDSDYYFIQNEGEEPVLLSNDEIQTERDGRVYSRKSNRYIGVLKATYADCPELQDKIEHANYSHPSLIKITTEYHDYVCDDQSCIVYEKQLPTFRVGFNPYLGFSISGLSFSGFPEYEDVEFRRSPDPVLGLRLHIALPRLNEKLSMLITGEVYRSYLFGSGETEQSTSSSVFKDVHAHITTFQTLIGIQYMYPKGKIRPNISAGAVYAINLKSEFRHVNEYVSQTLVSTREFYEDPLHRESYGAFIELGAIWKMNEWQGVSLGFRYHFIQETFGARIWRDAPSVNIGYVF